MARLVGDLAALMRATAGAAAKRTAFSAGAFAVVGLLVTTAYVALVAAVAISLGHRLGIVAALGVVAVAALLLAAVLALLAQSANRAARQKADAEARLRRLAITAAITLLPDRIVLRPIVVLTAIGVGFGLAQLLSQPPDDKT